MIDHEDIEGFFINKLISAGDGRGRIGSAIIKTVQHVFRAGAESNTQSVRTVREVRLEGYLKAALPYLVKVEHGMQTSGELRELIANIEADTE